MSFFANCVFITRKSTREKPFTATIRDENGNFKWETSQSFFTEEEVLDYAQKLSVENGLNFHGDIYDIS